MRKFYAFLIAVLTVCGLAQAQTTITFTAGEDVGTQTNAGDGEDMVSKDGITIAVTKGAFAAAQYRFGKGQTATFTSSVGNITKIVFTCSAKDDAQYGPGCFAAQDGYSFEDNQGTWTGSATEVTFVAEKAQVRATVIEVTVGATDPNFVAPPTIRPATGTYYAAQNVSITASEGASIYYTMDGSDPTTSSTVYVGPFTVENTTTVKAIAVKGENKSQVAESVITIETLSTKTIAEVIAAGAADNAQTAGVVYAAYPKGFVIGDGTGYIFTYCENTFSVGELVLVSGKVSLYGGCYQISNATVTAQGSTTIVYPEVNEIDGAALDALAAAPSVTYIKVQGKLTSTGNYKNFSVEGATMVGSILSSDAVFGNAKVDDEIEVTGFYVYNTGSNKYANIVATQVKVAGGDTPGPDPEVQEYTKIADMQTAAQSLGTEKVAVKYTFTNAIVLGVKSKNIYITDNQRGLLLYGTNSKNLKAGDVISGTISGELQLYNGVTELGNANFDEVSVVEVEIVAIPVVATIADITNAATRLNYESMLVTINDVNIVVEEGTVKAIDDSDNEVVLFDNYSFGLADLKFLDNETYNVTAIVGKYRETIQLYPRSKEDIDGQFEEPSPYEVEGDGSMGNPYTVADVLHIGNVSADAPQGWVKGYIVGYVNGQSYATGCIFSADAPEGTDNEGQPLTASNTNIVIAGAADVKDPAQCVPVQLANKYGMREALSLKDVPENLGKEIWLHGDCIKYFSVPGVKNIDDWSFDGQTTTTGIKTVRQNVAATIYNLNGQRVKNADKAGIYVVNGSKMVVK